MSFVTKLDYSDNRQIKQFQLTNTKLSGTTEFGLDVNDLGGVNESTVYQTGTLVNITSTFSGNSSTTIFWFGDSSMIPAASSLYAITNLTSGDTQTARGFEGVGPTIVDGNNIYSGYTGSTYDLIVTAITETGVNEWTGETYSSNVAILSGASADFTGRAIWVDVLGVTRTKRLILADKPDSLTGVTTVLTRDEFGDIYEVEFSAVTNDNYISGATFSASTGDLVLTNTSGETITTNLDGRYLPLSATTGDDYVTGSTYDSSTGLITFERLSGGTFTANIDITSGDTANWNSAYNDIITGATVTGTSNKTLTLTQRNGVTITAPFVDLTGGGAGETITGITFNTSTGDLILTTNSGSTIPTNLDGRYSLTGHTHDFSGLTNTGHTHTVSEVTDFPTNVSFFTNDVGYITGYTDTNDNIYVTGSTFNISDGILTFTNISGGTFTVDLDGRYLTGYTETSNTDDYVTGATWDQTTGIIEFTRLSGSTFNVDIDNRYSLTGHTHAEYLTGYTDNNDYVTGVTFNTLDGNLTLSTLSGTSIIENLDGRYLTGYTETGNTDDYLTGHTFNTSSGLFTSTLQSGGTVSVNLDGRYLPISAYTDNDTDDYVTGATFNTTNGILSLNRLSGGTVTVDLDDRYSLTGHTHDLSGLTNTGHTHTVSEVTDFPTNVSFFTNDVGYITGYTDTDDYLTTHTFNTSTGLFESTLQSGGTVSVNLDGRYAFSSGHTHTVSQITDFPTDLSAFTNSVGYITGYTDTNDNDYVSSAGFDIGTGVLTLTRLSGGTVTVDLDDRYSLSGHTHPQYLTGYTDNNDYITSGSFNPANGEVTLTRVSGGTVVYNLDGRYSLTGHTHTVSEITDFPSVVSYFTNDVGYLTAYTDTNIFVSGGTFNSEILEFTNTSGGTFNIDLSNTYTLTGHTHTVSNITDFPTNISYFTNDVGYITGFTDTNDYVTSGVFDISTGNLTLTRVSGGTVVTNLDNRYSLTGHTHVGLSDDYVSSAGFDISTGVLTLTRISGGTVTVDLDDRYSLSGHTHTVSEITDFPIVISYFTNDVGYLTAYTDTNIFVSGGTFSSELLEFTNTSGGTFNIDLSNTYALTGHTHTISDITDYVVVDDYVTTASLNQSTGDLTLTRLSGDTVVTNLGFTSGDTTNWNSAYNDIITGATFTGLATKTLTLTQRDGNTITANFTDNSGGGAGETITGATFDTSTGDLDLNSNSGNTITTNLDGRYSLTGHTHVVADITDFPTDLSGFTNGPGYITGFTDTNDNIFVSGATFNTGDGVLEFTNTSGGTFNIDLDGRYLTGYTDNDDYVTGATFNAGTGDLTLSTLSGNTIIENLDGRYLTGYTETGNTDDYVTSGSFNTTNGEVTLTRVSGGTVVYDLDGRYSLTGHTHDFSTLTNTGHTHDFSEITNTGHTHTVSEITDFPTDLSAFTNSVGYITGFTDTNDYLTTHTFNTSTGLFESTLQSGGTVSVNLDGRYLPISAYTDNDTNIFVSGGTFNSEILEFTNTSGGTFNIDLSNTYSLTGHTHTISDITDYVVVDDYVNSAGFDIGTGVLTLTRLSGGTVTVDLDDRYSLSGHTHDFSELTNTGHTHTVSEITDFPTNVSYFTNDVGYLTAFTDTNIFVSGATFNTGNGIIEFTNTSGGTFNVDIDNRYLLSSDYNPTDDYVTSGSFNTTNGVLTLTRLSGGTVTTNLDNRYSLTGHTHDFSGLTNTGHTHTVSEITDFPTNVSYFTNDVGYLTGYTETGNTDDYVTGGTFNATNGNLTLTRLSGGTVVTNLDNRYSLTAHTHDMISKTIDINPTDLTITATTKAAVIDYINALGHVKTSDNSDLWFKVNPNYILDVASEGDFAGTPMALTISSGGTVLYLGLHNGNCNQYILSTPWDVTTATFTASTATLGQGGGLHVSPDGLHITYSNGDLTGGTVDIYSMTTPHDLSSLSLVSTTGFSENLYRYEIYMTDDGLNLYTSTGSNIKRYTLATPYDFSGVTLSDTWSISLSHGFTFSNDLKTFFGFQSGENLRQYDLTVAGDLTPVVGGTPSNEADFNFIGGNFLKCAISPNGKRLIVTTYLAAPDVFSYGLSVANTIGSVITATNPDVVIYNDYYRLKNYPLGLVSGVIDSDVDEITQIKNNDITTLVNLDTLSNNDYVNSASFATGTGILTLTRLSGDTVTVDLDGRYSLTGHTHDLSGLTNTGHTHTVSEVTDFPTNVSFFTNDVGYLTGYTETGNTDDYVTGGTFNVTNGNLTLTRVSGGTVNVDLDGRYLLITGFTAPTGLEAIDEGNGIGWRLISRNSSNFGDIGLDAVDFSRSTSTSTTRGAVGDFSFAAGENNIVLSDRGTVFGSDNTLDLAASRGFVCGYQNTANNQYTFVANRKNLASGNASSAFGFSTVASGEESFAIGDDSIAAGTTSFCAGDGGTANGAYSSTLGGQLNNSNGDSSACLGVDNDAYSYGEFSIGIASTVYIPTSTIAWAATDRVFNVGNGVAFGVKSDAFTILKNGTITAPSLSNDIILTGDSKIIITKDYLNTYYSPTSGITNNNDYVTSGSFNPANGEVTLTRLSGGTVVYDLDGRYSLTGHTHPEFDNYLFLSGGTLTGPVTGTTFNVSDALLDYQENLDVLSAATEVVATVSKLTYDAVFFDYVVKKDSNLRAGIVMAVHDGTSVTYTDTSTADLGDTSGVVFTVNISGNDLRLVASVTTDNWIIKTLLRGI